MTTQEAQVSTTDHVDGTAEELEPATAVATQPTVGVLAVTPQADAQDLVARLDVIREAMHTAMQDGVDYGRIPGVDKPTLLKPGAEKLGVLFQLDVQLENEKEWGPGEHLTVNSKATVYHAPTGTRLGFGEGLCTTRERKYAKRKQERVCPSCGAPAVIKGKAEFGGGWVCWKKRDGCGASFKDGDGAIESQDAGEVENPDLPDLWNTVLKMSEKRARVDAVLAVTGASALFTQDAEDVASEAPVATPAPAHTGPPTLSPEQAARVRKAVDEAGVLTEDLEGMLAAVGAESIESMTAAQAKRFKVELDRATLPWAPEPEDPDAEPVAA